MCLTLLQELKGRLYFEDYSYSNCVNSIILLNFVYRFTLVLRWFRVNFFSYWVFLCYLSFCFLSFLRFVQLFVKVHRVCMIQAYQ